MSQVYPPVNLFAPTINVDRIFSKKDEKDQVNITGGYVSKMIGK